MRKSIIITIFLCFSLSSVAVAEDRLKIDRVTSRATIENFYPNIFRPIGDLFRRIWGRKRINTTCSLPASVIALELSKTEVFSCSPNLLDKNGCKGDQALIDVFTITVDYEEMIFDYRVSGGKIVGTGAKVVWNLTGVKPGNYTITVAVDDGCGFCGTPKTTTIIVKDCDC